MTTRPTTPAVASLLDELDRLRARLEKDGDLIWQRTEDWVKPRVPAAGERGGGSGEGPSDYVLEERKDDAAASRYYAEVRAITKRMTDDSRRLCEIASLAVPPKSAVLTNRNLQAAQVAAEGWCVSCWRDELTCEPIALRPTGEPYYKDRCRGCGMWKAEHGQDPPLAILQKRHAGIRVTTRDVEAATGKAS